MLKIIIADDHPMVRAGLVQSINKEPDLKVLFECENGEELLSQLSREDYDIVILDLGLPGRSGIEILEEIRKIAPSLPVLVLSAYPEERYGVRAVKAGANAYLNKEEKKEQILEAIRRIKGGNKFITPKLAASLALELDKNTDKLPHERLSERELEVMIHIAKGKSVSEIAELLSLSINTINTYRARIIEKTALKSNTQIALYALENKLLD